MKISSHVSSYSVESLLEKIQEQKIRIAVNHTGDIFQRGDEETGVWNITKKRLYINSLYDGFPAGILTLIQNKNDDYFMVLDGGNRLRTIRDYMSDLFSIGEDKKFYKDMNEYYKAKFKTIHIPCQEVEIKYEVNDNESQKNIVCDMFERLNTTSTKLSEGELIKACGWRNDVEIIEFAKILTNKSTNNTCLCDDQIEKINDIKLKWESVIGVITDNNRCNVLSLACSFIVSANENNILLFDNHFKTLKQYIRKPILESTYSKIYKLLDIIQHMVNADTNIKTLFNISKKTNMFTRINIAPIWYLVLDNFTSVNEETLIHFYKLCYTNESILKTLKNILIKSDNHITNKKIHQFIDLIKNTI